jgi:hypothetical protein
MCVWLASSNADFLRGRLLWANWDVEEMKQREQEIVEKNLLTIALSGLESGEYLGLKG